MHKASPSHNMCDVTDPRGNLNLGYNAVLLRHVPVRWPVGVGTCIGWDRRHPGILEQKNLGCGSN